MHRMSNNHSEQQPSEVEILHTRCMRIGGLFLATELPCERIHGGDTILPIPMHVPCSKDTLRNCKADNVMFFFSFVLYLCTSNCA